jgi:hypothetical protein
MPLTPSKDALPARQRRLAAAKGIDRSIALAARLYINLDVDPSFCHLPVAA